MPYPLRPISLSLMLALLATGASHARPGKQATMVDYWALIAPTLAGDYGGSCAVTGLKDAVRSPYVVGRDGKLETAGLQADLRRAQSFSVQAKTGIRGRYLSVAAKFEDGTASITTESNPQETRATLLRDDMQIRCHSATTAAHLAEATPHLLIAPFLASPATTVTCAAPEGRTPKKVRYEYVNGKLTVGPHVIVLRDAVEEVLHFEQAYQRPAYSARGARMSSSVLVEFDNKGAIAKLSYPANDGEMASCVVLSASPE